MMKGAIAVQMGVVNLAIALIFLWLTRPDRSSQPSNPS